MKNSYHSKIKPEITLFLKWARDLSRHFFSEDRKITNKYEKTLNIMSLKKYKIIVTNRITIMTNRMAKIRKKNNTKC